MEPRAESWVKALDSDSWNRQSLALREIIQVSQSTPDLLGADLLEPRLERLAASSKWEVRRRVAQLLGHYRSDLGTRLLLRLTNREHESNARVLSAARRSLSRWQSLERQERERQRRESTLYEEMTRLRAEDPATARRVETLGFNYAVEIVGGIGHDLGRSAQVATLVRDALLEEFGEAQVGELADRLSRQAEFLSALRRDTNAFAQRSTPPRAATQVVKVIDTVVQDLGPKLASVELTTRVEPGLQVFVPQEQLGRAINNLLRNAAEALGEDEGGAILVRAYEAGDELDYRTAVLEVVDNGPGIEDLETLRLPFKSTKKQRGQGVHSGLGLAIVSRLVERDCAGRFEIVTEKGEGTTARLYLPMEET